MKRLNHFKGDKLKEYSIKDLILISIFSSLTAIGAFIRIPLPFTLIPITLQSFFSFYAGLILGPKKGFYSQVIYILIGLLGIPVFTKGGGPFYIFEPSFGYLIGFAFASYVIGYLYIRLKQYKTLYVFLILVLGQIIIYFFGFVHLYILTNFYFKEVSSFVTILSIGVVPFIITDLIIIIIVSITSLYVLKKLR